MAQNIDVTLLHRALFGETPAERARRVHLEDIAKAERLRRSRPLAAKQPRKTPGPRVAR